MIANVDACGMGTSRKQLCQHRYVVQRVALLLANKLEVGLEWGTVNGRLSFIYSKEDKWRH